MPELALLAPWHTSRADSSTTHETPSSRDSNSAVAQPTHPAPTTITS